MRYLIRVGVLASMLALPTTIWGFTVSVPILEQIQMFAFKQQMLDFLEMIKQTENQIRSLQNQALQIKHAYTTVEHGVKNLAKLDLNGAEDLLNIHRQLASKIRQIDSIGYTAERSWKNAERVYAKADRMLSAAERKALELGWIDVERDAAQVSIETQAILKNQEEHQKQWQDILNAAHAAEGSLQAQQAGVQAQGVLGSQMQEMTQILATNARHESMKVLKEATRTEMEQTALQHITTEINTSYQSAGRRLSMTKTGRE